MSGQPETTTTQDAINTLLQNGLSDGLPTVAEMLVNASTTSARFSLGVRTRPTISTFRTSLLPVVISMPIGYGTPALSRQICSG